MINREFWKVFLRAKEEKGLPYDEIASRIGINLSTVTTTVSSERGLSLENAIKYAKAVGIHLLTDVFGLPTDGSIAKGRIPATLEDALEQLTKNIRRLENNDNYYHSHRIDLMDLERLAQKHHIPVYELFLYPTARRDKLIVQLQEGLVEVKLKHGNTVRFNFMLDADVNRIRIEEWLKEAAKQRGAICYLPSIAGDHLKIVLVDEYDKINVILQSNDFVEATYYNQRCTIDQLEPLLLQLSRNRNGYKGLIKNLTGGKWGNGETSIKPRKLL